MNIIRKIVMALLSFNLMILIMGICLLSTLPTFLTPCHLPHGHGASECLSVDSRAYSNSLEDIMLFNNIDCQTMRDLEVKEVVIRDGYALVSWLEGIRFA